MVFKGVTFNRTPEGKLYAVTDILWQEYLHSEPIAPAFVNSIIRAVDEDTHS